MLYPTVKGQTQTPIEQGVTRLTETEAEATGI